MIKGVGDSDGLEGGMGGGSGAGGWEGGVGGGKGNRSSLPTWFCWQGICQVGGGGFCNLGFPILLFQIYMCASRESSQLKVSQVVSHTCLGPGGR